MYGNRYSSQILSKIEFSRQNFQKILNYQISWKSVHWDRVVPCSTTAGHTDITKLTFSFHHFENATENIRTLYALINYLYFKLLRYRSLSWRFHSDNTSSSPTTQLYVFLLHVLLICFDFWSLSLDYWKRLTKKHIKYSIIQHI
jgi:hypothetical protein